MLRKLYPIGIQTFEKIIDEDYLYIDKTEYVYRMTHSDSKFMFLSRPRRFGKSLLTSTLQCYFEGKRELFKGLAIEKKEKEWTEYPVLHFDMSGGKHMQPDALQRYLLFILELKETEYGIVADAPDPNVRLLNLINTVHQQTGKKVVVLIDEYDAPLLDVVHEEAQLGILRDIMRNFYSPLKYCEPKLQFVFLTGITKFSQMSIFSELNIEIILDKDDNVHFLELGPRAGGNMIPIQLGDAFGIDLVKANVQAAMGEKPEFLAETINPLPGCYLHYVLHSYEAGIFKGISIDESISKNVYRQVIYKNEGDPVEVFDGAGKALGIVFLHFDNAAQTENFCKNHDTLIKNILE